MNQSVLITAGRDNDDDDDKAFIEKYRQLCSEYSS